MEHVFRWQLVIMASAISLLFLILDCNSTMQNYSNILDIGTILPDIYGNEIFEELNMIKFTEKEFPHWKYFESVENCNIKKVRIYKCSLGTHKSTGIPLMAPDASRGNSGCILRDCTYYLDSMTAMNHGINFIVHQINCSHHKNNSKAGILGGSSFEIFMRDNHNIVGCLSHDQFNGSYAVSCPLSKFILSFANDMKSNRKIHHEIYLTILLAFEYYGGLGEIIECNMLDSDTTAILYDDTPMNINIYEYMSPTKTYLRYNSSNEYNYSMKVWYTAKWQKQSSSFNSEVHQMNLIDFEQRKVNISTVKINIPLFHHNIQTNNIYYDDWVIERSFLDHTNKNLIESKQIANKSSFYIQNKTFHGHNNDIDSCLVSLSITNNIYSNKKMTYFFVGDSHVRFFFDFFMYQTHGIGPLLKYSAKHSSGHQDNMLFIQSTFARNQYVTLLEICGKRNKINATDPLTIIMQTGQWDLTFASLRHLIYDNGYGWSLIKVISDILEGRNPCPGLVNFVWLTTCPSPLSIRDRAFRTNSNIRALNEFYLNSLLNMNVVSHIRLAIVDVFNIIYPRIGLLQDEEVVCHTHYICREDHNLSVLLVTPGGLAAAQAIQHAICDYFI